MADLQSCMVRIGPRGPGSESGPPTAGIFSASDCTLGWTDMAAAAFIGWEDDRLLRGPVVQQRRSGRLARRSLRGGKAALILDISKHEGCCMLGSRQLFLLGL